jgi:hypothetical protein
MKTIITIISVLLLNSSTSAQQWVQTGGIPDGAGITEMIITPQGTLLVTTASFSALSGFLGGVRRSTDDGNTWQNTADVYNGRTIYLGEDGVVFASYWDYPNTDESIYRSTDDGVSWERLHGVPTGDNIFAITTKDNNNTIFIGTRNGVKRSTNAGVNWSYVNTGIPANSWVKDIGTDTSSGIVVVATTKGLFSTTNNGSLWEPANGSGQDTIVSIVFEYDESSFDNSKETRALFASNEGRIYESFSDARYLTLVFLNVLDNGYDPKMVRAYLQEENRNWYGVGTFSTKGNLNESGGFNLSRNEGQTFERHNDGLPSQTRPSSLAARVSLMRDEITEVQFFLGSYNDSSDGAKIYRLTYIVGIEQISSEIPSGFRLNQNYPNPFNPSTKINFDIPSNYAIVKLSVFNSLGQEVAVLVDQKLGAGSYEYTFEGAALNSGVYFYKLQADNFSETKKMLLIK